MLYALQTPNCKMRSAILKNCDDKLIHSICEMIQNVMIGNVPLDKKKLTHLKKYKKEMRLIKSYNDKKKPIGLKRKLLVQRGGFIPNIIAAILSSAVGALINHFTSK